MKTIKQPVLALFCAGLLMATTSCNRGSGCGTWGKVKTNKSMYRAETKDKDHFANYKRYNN